MLKKITLLTALAGSLLFTSVGSAQTYAELEENKRIAMEFFRPGITVEERADLLHDDYQQHNPAFKKYADERGLSYKEGFMQMMGQIMAGGRGGGRGGQGPQPPQGDNTYMVLAEGDTVFIMRQQFAQDPTEPPGTFYERFAWDVFTIRDGKLYEHWDGGVINPPAGD